MRKRRLLLTLIGGLALSFSCGLLFLNLNFNNRNRPEIPLLSMPSDLLNFGYVSGGEVTRRNIPVANTTDQTIRVSFASSCLCLAVRPTFLELPPRGTANLELTLNVRPGASSGAFYVVVHAISGEGATKNRQEWRIGYRVRDAQASPFVLDSTHCTLSAASNFADAELSEISLTATTPITDCRFEPIDALTSDVRKVSSTKFMLTVSPMSGSKLTSGIQYIKLHVTMMDGSKYNRLIPIIFEANPMIRAMPSMLLLGAFQVGSTASEMIQLVSRRDSFRVVGMARASSPVIAVAVRGSNLTQTLPLDVTVTVKASEAGRFEGSILLELVNNATNVQEIVVVPVYYMVVN